MTPPQPDRPAGTSDDDAADVDVDGDGDGDGDVDVDVDTGIAFLRALASSTTTPTPPVGEGELAGALGAVARLVDAERQARARADEAVVDAEAAWHDAVDLLLSANVDDLALRRVNNGLVAAVGLPREALVGAPLLSLFVERSHADVREAVRAIVAGERPPAVDLELATAIDGRGTDGSTAPQRRMLLVRLRGHIMRRAGQAPRLNVALRDVTDERALEGRLLEAQKLEALGRLAGSVAHDFNNLLVVMQGTIDMLVPLLDGDGAEDVAAFSEAARRAAQITGQLLAFSRQELVRHADVDVARSVGKVRPILERLAGRAVRIDVAIDDGLPPAHIDETRLHQVLVNLVVNARDAMPDGGVIAIHASARSRMHNGVTRPGVRLVVQDTGPGVPPELRKTIFEPFFTTKPQGKGTGLGLSTVHGIIHHAGGDIAVDGDPGEGARFVIDLPVNTTSTLPSTRTPY